MCPEGTMVLIPLDLFCSRNELIGCSHSDDKAWCSFGVKTTLTAEAEFVDLRMQLYLFSQLSPLNVLLNTSLFWSCFASVHKLGEESFGEAHALKPRVMDVFINPGSALPESDWMRYI